MALTLQVTSFQNQALGAHATKTFGAQGGTIGRRGDNDWVLPDPERFVSSQHAVISLENGAFVLTDCSTNGTVVNGRELVKGGRVPLGNGDLVTIGNYEISVLVGATPAAQPPGPAAAGRLDSSLEPEAASVPGAESSVDPLDFLADMGDVSVPQAPSAAPDHSPPYSDFFAPPSVGRDPQIPSPAQAPTPAELPPQAPPAAAGGGAAIPENWDETGLSATSPPASPAGGSGSKPPPAPLHDSRSEAEPFAPPPRPPSPAPPTPAPVRATEPTSSPAARPPAAGPAGSAADVTALLRSAGVDPATVDAATLAALGDILRVAVEGLMEVLRARTEIKNQFRVPMTTLKPVENNPLKFSANVEDALFNLFARRGQSYKAPVDAFREAFDDLKAHQIATMAGMRAAFTALMGHFDPDRLQEGFDRGLKRNALLDVMNKTKYWELYREMYNELGDDDATFRRLFGDQFAQAYEEQMQRLTALQRRR